MTGWAGPMQLEGLRYEILGGVGVRRGAEPVKLSGAQVRQVLAALLVDAPRVVTKETLAERLWGDDPPTTAKTAIRVLVGRLRRALEPGRHDGEEWTVLRTTSGGYVLELHGDEIDATRYEELVSEAESLAEKSAMPALRCLESARALWKGRPWGDLAEEPWLQGHSVHLEERRRRADELWADLELGFGRHDLLLGHLCAAVEDEPLRERRWEQLMLALYRSGRQADALRAFQDARRVLVEELGIEPGPGLQDIERGVLAQDPRLEVNLGRPAPDRPRHNLPASLTGLVGRRDDVQAVRKRLTASRLVTITGPAGAGKTRLAGVVAQDMLDEQHDGAWFVDLTAAPTPELVAAQLASELGLREGAEHGPGGPLEIARMYLQERELLIVLDNCEHVTGEVARVTGLLLGTCPNVRVLATSRIALGVVGETCYLLAPLEVPASDASLDEVVASPAVQLFLERADDVSPAAIDVDQQLGAIAALCRFLEGVPLAIELAAISTRTLSPTEILHRLDSRLALVADADVQGLPRHRHRALRTTIDWSHALLSEREQAAFRQLSVFHGGFTLAGAAAVMAASSDTAIGTVGRLVAASLVRPDQRRSPARYQMLEVIREYAAERLSTTGEEREVRARQFDHYVGLAGSVRRDGAVGPPVRENLLALDAEHDGVRDTLDRLLSAQDGEQAARLAGVMGTYWFERGYCAEGQRWLTRALELTIGSRSACRARALLGLAETSSEFEGIRSRLAELEEAAELTREHGTSSEGLYALSYLSIARALQGDKNGARAAVEEVRTIATELANPWVDTTLSTFGNVWLTFSGKIAEAHAGFVQNAGAYLALGDETFASRVLMYAGIASRLTGELLTARRELEQSSSLAGKAGIWGTRAHAQLALAQVAIDLSDDDATSLFVECLETLELLGDARCIAICQRSLGSLALDAGRYDEALDWLRRSLDVLAAHDHRALAVAISDIATILSHCGEGVRASRLVESARGLARGSGLPLSDEERARIDAAADAVDRSSPAATSSPATSRHATLDLDDILAIAHEGSVPS